MEVNNDQFVFPYWETNKEFLFAKASRYKQMNSVDLMPSFALIIVPF